jgi:N-acetylglucosaminyl-diphospho-decaprenol L-rhamnosyltransferase
MNNSHPRVTIAVQSYKNVEMLRMCLDSVSKHASRADVEVIVADAATSHETAMLMREEFPSFQFISHKKNVGFVALVNTCLERSLGEYIFILNPDTLLEEATIDDLLVYMDAHQSVGMCGPAQKNFNGTKEITRFDFYKPITILYRRTFLGRLPAARDHLEKFELRNLWKNLDPYPVPWIMGSAMFIRRSAYDKVGGMDTRFFMYMEDVDWCRRFWEQGICIMYHPNITLFHFYGKGSAGNEVPGGVLFNRLTWIHMKSALLYFWKYKMRKSPFDYKQVDFVDRIQD